MARTKEMTVSREDTAARVREWVGSERGKQEIREAVVKARQTIERLRESRRLHLESLNKPMAI